MFKKLLDIRLSYIYPLLFGLFFGLLSVIEPQKLTPGQLALYSVNTFLFGFYFSPILGAQKNRIEALNQTVRQEAMVILDILAQSHLLKPEVRHQLKLRLRLYVNSINGNQKVRADNHYYDELLRFSKQKEFQNNTVMDTIYTRIARSQENRDTLQSLFFSKVYSHEWMVMLVLFAVTIYFIIQTDYGNTVLFRGLMAIFCTGVSLMLIILVKYASLTHKHAKKMWRPLQDLIRDHFEDVESAEIVELKRQIDAAAAR
jgi:hypothetical protein